MEQATQQTSQPDMQDTPQKMAATRRTLPPVVAGVWHNSITRLNSDGNDVFVLGSGP
ncbi:MAG: hypothetical protein ACR2M0_10280 [Chloroflexia bacterium]